MMLKSYARRLGHFTDAQKRAYYEYGEKYLIPYSETLIDFKKEFNNSKNVTMEIGFGSGFATIEIAKTNQDKNYLGIEVHKPGIGRVIQEINNHSLSNIRIIEYDAVHVALKMIKQGSLEAIHIFFPDPWPKKRHRKRRLIQRPFTETLANCLKQEGYIYIVTDWEDYALHAMEELTATKTLNNAFEGFSPAQSWRPKTRFEEKGIAKQHIIRELMFIKS
ncbi:MAG: tRNA (guanosine(46)-N7)-methyltransferase TrmB [Treponema sp.]|nr:tRNA (guanosine(46)-N7)-methyltransferase TrmB [Treponema sp.]MCL2251946.1 tRNA (guanosine(46)-N7)-methyltransferase TrmB [Treponema sp.]